MKSTTEGLEDLLVGKEYDNIILVLVYVSVEVQNKNNGDTTVDVGYVGVCSA